MAVNLTMEAFTYPYLMSGRELFPTKLHLVLEGADKYKHSHILSWLPDGTSFKILDRRLFESEILPVFFGTSKYKSFQRNLNLWGFCTVTKGACRGECSHPHFKRGLPDLCRSMRRVAIKGNGPKRPVKAKRYNNSEREKFIGREISLPASFDAALSLHIRNPAQEGKGRPVARDIEPVGPLADFLRKQQRVKQYSTVLLPSSLEKQQAVAATAAKNEPNPLRLAMLQGIVVRQARNVAISTLADQLVGNLFALQQRQKSAAEQQIAMKIAAVRSSTSEGRLALLGGRSGNQLVGPVAAPNMRNDAVSNLTRILLERQMQQQPDPAVLLTARKTITENEAVIMRLLADASAIQRA